MMLFLFSRNRKFSDEKAEKLIKKFCNNTLMAVNYEMSGTEHRLTFKKFGYDNLLMMALLAIAAISLLIWLIKGVE